MANFVGSETLVAVEFGTQVALSSSGVGPGVESGVFAVPPAIETNVEVGYGDSAPTPAIPAQYLQRVFDDTLVAYVYFTRESTNPASPAIGTGDTEPNNTGNLNLTNHAVLAEV